MLKWYIDHGVDVARVKGGQMEPTLLFWARSPEVAELLIDHGIDINVKDAGGQTALFRIEQMNENAAKIIPVLLKHGADPNMRVNGGYTPLMAARDGATVDVLLAAGADPDAKDDNGVSVIDRYVPMGEPSRAEALRRHGVPVNAGDKSAMLVNAILKKNIGEVKSLLAAGADPDLAQDADHTSPMTIAVGQGQFEIADLLRQAGGHGVGVFSEAAAKGDVAQMQALVDAGADVNETMRTGETPLSFAARCIQVKAVQFLLDHGANPNLFNVYGFTPYSDSCEMAMRCDSWKQMGRAFPLINGMNATDAAKGFQDIMALISRAKPDVNYRNKDGETALHAAAKTGNTEAFDLPNYSPDINAQRNDGMTPLMLAIATQPKNADINNNGSVILNYGTPKAKYYSARGWIVMRLLAKGADVTLKNKAGKTAMDLARENGNAEILQLMLHPPRKDPPPIKDGGKYAL